jgi:hypothetical protein
MPCPTQSYWLRKWPWPVQPRHVPCAKSHTPFPLLRSYRRISLTTRPLWIFRNIINFLRWGVVSTSPTPNFHDAPGFCFKYGHSIPVREMGRRRRRRRRQTWTVLSTSGTTPLKNRGSYYMILAVSRLGAWQLKYVRITVHGSHRLHRIARTATGTSSNSCSCCAKFARTSIKTSTKQH